MARATALTEAAAAALAAAAAEASPVMGLVDGPWHLEPGGQS